MANGETGCDSCGRYERNEHGDEWPVHPPTVALWGHEWAAVAFMAAACEEAAGVHEYGIPPDCVRSDIMGDLTRVRSRVEPHARVDVE